MSKCEPAGRSRDRRTRAFRWPSLHPGGRRFDPVTAHSRLPRDGAGAARQHPARTCEVTRVSVRVTLEIVLMLGLGLPERPRRRHLGDHLAGPETRGLDIRDRVPGDATLLVVEIEDRRAIAH